MIWGGGRVSIFFHISAGGGCDISKHTFVRSGSSKKTVLFNFDRFKHSMCSSNSSHENKICGGYTKVYFWQHSLELYIKIHIYKVKKLNKESIFLF